MMIERKPEAPHRNNEPEGKALGHNEKPERDRGHSHEKEHKGEPDKHDHQKESEIIVNGRKRIIPGHIVTFEQVVSLAEGLPSGPNIVYDVTYKHAAQHPSQGSLAPGGKVKVRKGTVFNVSATDKS